MPVKLSPKAVIAARIRVRHPAAGVQHPRYSRHFGHDPVPHLLGAVADRRGLRLGGRGEGERAEEREARRGSQRAGGAEERKDIAELHHGLRDKPYQANRTLGVLSKMFSLAEVWGWRADGSNPCRHVKRYKERKRERFLSPEETERLGGVLREAEDVMPSAVAAIRLLLLTGCRLSEIQFLRWEYVKGDCIELPDAKTGGRVVPLGPEASAVLSALPPRGGQSLGHRRQAAGLAPHRFAETLAPHP